MNLEVIFRVDGSSKTGLGHLVRCMALSHMLRDGFEITFVCKEIPEELIRELKEAGFKLVKIQREEEFIALLNLDSLAILDGYQFDTVYQKRIKETGSKLVVIDDVHENEFYADLIINHTPGVKAEDYLAQTYTKFALGLEFVLLRPAFLERCTEPRVRSNDTLLICFGGSDFKKFTPNTLAVALEFPQLKKIIVITGASFTYSEDLQILLNSDPRIDYRHALSEMQMVKSMTEADIAIVPSSGILFETLAMGCRVISGIYADNQKLVYANFLSMNLIAGAANFNSDSVRKMLDIILSSPHNKVHCIDGNSPKRLRSFILEVKCSLREVDMSDSELLFNWANDCEVRENAISKDLIIFEKHLKWLDAKLKSTNSKIFVLEIDRIPVGQIRYDLLNGEWTLSYSIDAKWRKRGLGKIIIKLSIEYFQNQSLRALVKESNVASKSVFMGLGFRQTGEFMINSDLYIEFKLKM